MDDYVEQQSKCYVKARDSLDAIGKCMNRLNTLVEALYFVGNEPLAMKIHVIICDVDYHIEAIKDANSQKSDNYMKMSREADKEFLQTIFNKA